MTTYYVASNGLDTNDGLSLSAPWQTLAKVNSSTFLPGDSILLRRGDTWREQLTPPSSGESGNLITFGAYGTGERPIIDASDAIPIAGITKTGGATNVYQATISPAVAASKTWINSWQDSTQLVKVASTALCDSTPGSFYPSSETVAPLTLYFHPTDSSDPTTSGKTYYFSARQHAIDAYYVTYVSIDNIDVGRNLHEDGSLRLGKYCKASNMIAFDGSKHNVLNRTGTYLYNIEADKFYYGSTPSSAFVYNEDVANDEGVEYVSCSSGNGGVYRALAAGFLGHVNTSGSFGTVTYTDCVSADTNSAFEGNNATLVFNNPVITNTSIGFGTGANTTINGGSFVGAAALSNRLISVDGGVSPTIEINGFMFNAAGNYVGGGVFYWPSNAHPTISIDGLIATGQASSLVFYSAGTGSVTVENSSFTTFLDLFAVSADTSFSVSRCVFSACGLIPTSGVINLIFKYNIIKLGRSSRDAMTLKGATSPSVYNNVFYNSVQNGIRLMDDGAIHTTDANVVNNFFVKCTLYGVVVDANNTLASFSHNGFYQNTSGNYSGVSAGIGDITTDPLFVSAATGDFRVPPTSPAVNAGVGVSLTSDFIGNPIYGLPDIGAYEYQYTRSIAPITIPGPLSRDATVVSGTTLSDAVIKAPLGPEFQAITEWTNNASVDLATFTPTARTRVGPRGVLIYGEDLSASDQDKADRYLGI